MCASSGSGGTLASAFRSLGAKWSGKTATAAGGVTSGGASGPSAAAAAGAAYMRRKAGAPLLDTLFGVEGN